ncbi:MAG: C40 family peptidase [Lachnospiraceae bacterium]|nr:C40 family peptidase [Lachnospiraceae bacterium]
MKKFGVRVLNSILTAALVIGLWAYPEMPVYADRTMSEVQDSIDQYQEILDSLDEQISTLTDEQDLILEEMDDLNAEIINLMTTISILEDDIAQKELDIEATQAEYEAAKKVAEDQQTAMMIQAKMTYESGQSSWFSLLLESESFADMLNRMTYAKSVQAYNDKLLTEYENTKQQVQDLWDRLEKEKTELQVQKADLEGQKAYCDELMAQLKETSDNYDSLIAQAQKEAKNAKSALQKEQKELKRLQEEERRRQEAERKRQEALNKTYATTNYTELVDASSGSDEGKKIAKYGLQYIGNKYVYGGTSLENGTDCSGFTYRVYQAFGYNLPRTSYSQRSSGREVAYADAQPGDLICYSGHIGIYIGGGYIVHASNSQPYPRGGIKVSKATYRKILAVRRIID